MRISNIKDFKGKRIMVIGLGISGRSVIRNIAGYVKHITAVDSNPCIIAEKDFNYVKRIKNFSFDLVLSENANRMRKILDGIDLIIVSPGVPNEIPLLRRADRLRIPVWSEIEIGWRLLNKKEKNNTIAVTGTNGKTTVVTLLQKVLSDGDIKSTACGNIGNPLISTIYKSRGSKISNKNQGNFMSYEGQKDLVRVMEISSFQLERVHDFNPPVGIILNITSDHLDRHHSMKNYAEIKFRLFANSSSKSSAILNIDDEHIYSVLTRRDYFNKCPFNLINCSLDFENENACIRYKDSRILYDFNKLSGEIDISDISLKGKHNILNIMSVIAAARLFNVGDESIERTLKNFMTLEHRIEFIGEVNGIKIFNDSKATNPDATIKALESFEREVTLILGGKDKDMDFSILLPVMDKKVVNLILIGETKLKILKIIENYSRSVSGLPYSVYVCGSFTEAVDKGFSVTEKGNVLLLSPACASFDMFKDYKDRGNKFKKIVIEKITGGQKQQKWNL